MKIAVAGIKDKVIDLSVEEPVNAYPGLVAMQEEGECRFLAPLRIELSVAREYDLIRVHGRVATSVVLGCSRCLAEYEMAVDSSFTVFYSRATNDPLDEEIELTEEDVLSASYEGEEIDFSPVVEEQVIMGIPLKPLCKEECFGLCSSCGADLNSAPCDCDRSGINLKFSALKSLKIEK